MKPEEFAIGDRVLWSSKRIPVTVLSKKQVENKGWFYQLSNRPEVWVYGLLLDRCTDEEGDRP